MFVENSFLSPDGKLYTDVQYIYFICVSEIFVLLIHDNIYRFIFILIHPRDLPCVLQNFLYRGD